jgi:GAF domain-containing protein
MDNTAYMIDYFKEQERLQELYAYDILDSEAEKEYDELVELASQICECPITAINFIAKDRQWAKAHIGPDLTESREESFCAYTILNPAPFVVEDAVKDARFADNPAVKENIIRFYAGVPIYSAANQPLGAVCVIDNKPRTISPSQLAAL